MKNSHWSEWAREITSGQFFLVRPLNTGVLYKVPVLAQLLLTTSAKSVEEITLFIHFGQVWHEDLQSDQQKASHEKRVTWSLPTLGCENVPVNMTGFHGVTLFSDRCQISVLDQLLTTAHPVAKGQVEYRGTFQHLQNQVVQCSIVHGWSAVRVIE